MTFGHRDCDANRNRDTSMKATRSLKRISMWLGLLLAAAMPWSVQAGPIVEYIHTDHLGNVVAVTDENGNVVETSEYEPYGYVLNRPMGDSPGYTGHVEDAATGLVYMQQRYYDAGIGMFLSVDPVTAYSNPVGQFNRYRYANGNPYLFKDPDGRESGTAFRSVNNATNGGPVVPPPRSSSDWAGPAIGVSLAVVSAPAVALGAVELGTAVLANPATTNSVAIGLMEAGAGEALGGASLAVGGAALAEKSVQKGIRSLEKRIAQHEKKLADFKENPTVRPGMEDQPEAVIKAQQNARVQHLEGEIKTFKENIEKLKSGE